MNETMISNWNSRVKPKDEIFHIGDFSFANEEKTLALLDQLNGKKTLILGNHDRLIKKSRAIREKFEAVLDYHEIYLTDPTAKGGKRMIVMSHYAMLVWNKSHYGSIMLHGHSHGSLIYPFKARIMDVGVDANNYLPVSEGTVLSLGSVTPDSVDHHRSR